MAVKIKGATAVRVEQLSRCLTLHGRASPNLERWNVSAAPRHVPSEFEAVRRRTPRPQSDPGGCVDRLIAVIRSSASGRRRRIHGRTWVQCCRHSLTGRAHVAAHIRGMSPTHPGIARIQALSLEEGLRQPAAADWLKEQDRKLRNLTRKVPERRTRRAPWLQRFPCVAL